MTTNNATLAALRALLPYAEREADYLRNTAGLFAEHARRDTASADVSTHYAQRAEAATSAITAARLALQDAEAAAHHLNCHVRYAVTFDEVHVHGGSTRVLRHTVEVMAECADDAQAAAIAACEAANLIPGDVLRVDRVHA